MLYRSSDCILKQKAWKNIFLAFRRKILASRWKILVSWWKILGLRWKILASRWKILASRWKILGLRHTYRACFYVTQIARISQIFFRITKKARLRAFFIEPCSHCQPDARSASKAGRRKARRDNHTNEGAQTWLCHTDITDVTDIFRITKKARLRAFMQN